MAVLVSIITPTTPDRAEHLERLEQMVNAQDYHPIEWLIDEGEGKIGDKRNNLVSQAQGDIILHMDSDDTYAYDWVSKSVAHLLSTKANITGLSSAYFVTPDNKYKWKWHGSQPYVCEATMCYLKSAWHNRKFASSNSGEGLQFLQNNGLLIPHDYIDGFQANIHGTNTASHKMLSVMEVIY